MVDLTGTARGTIRLSLAQLQACTYAYVYSQYAMLLRVAFCSWSDYVIDRDPNHDANSPVTPASVNSTTSTAKRPPSASGGLRYPRRSARALFPSPPVDPAILMAVMNSDSSSDSNDSKARKYFIGKTRGLAWAEELEAYLEGKYTVIAGDNGAALAKQKANIRNYIVGPRKREIKSWWTNPGDDEVPIRQADGTTSMHSLVSMNKSVRPRDHLSYSWKLYRARPAPDPGRGLDCSP